MLIALAIKLTGVCHYIIEVAARKTTIVEVLVILLNVEIYRAVRLIGIARIEDALHHGNLLDDMS